MDTEYAPIDSTEWTLDAPARSTVRGSSHKFTHELGCPAQGSYQDCTCYVSRIRLVKTPVGEFIPTTEPDLNLSLDMWIGLAKDRRARAEYWERQARMWKRTAYITTGVAGLSMIISVGNLLRWF